MLLRIRIILLGSVLVRLLATKDTKDFVQQTRFLFVVVGRGRARCRARNGRRGEGAGSYVGRRSIVGFRFVAAKDAGKPRSRRRLAQHATAMQLAELRLSSGDKNLFACGRAGRRSELQAGRIDIYDADAVRRDEL